VLTVDFVRLGLVEGDRVLDLGCGGGRHAFEAYRRGANVVALDRSATDTADVVAMFTAMRQAGEVPVPGSGAPKGTAAGTSCTSRPRPPERPSGGAAVVGDAVSLPFPDGAFDRVVAAEVLEHVMDDRAAMAELARVLRPGGTMAVTVPRWFPEHVCWALADDYHAPAVVDGHVRVYRHGELAARLRQVGMRVTGSHHAHALHTPYWWLRCLLGVERADALPVRLYHRFLVWDITAPRRPVRLAERALNPLVGKSLVLYLQKPAPAARPVRRLAPVAG